MEMSSQVHALAALTPAPHQLDRRLDWSLSQYEHSSSLSLAGDLIPFVPALASHFTD